MSGNIPKVIHYCWFGRNPKTELAEKCIESWKKFCPGYEIKEWNEDNFDISMSDYSREAYDAKKWAFVSDIARLYALVNEGGIYMDTDVEVVSPLDPLLEYEAVSGFESSDRVLTSLMACEKGQPLFAEMLKDYENRHFLSGDGTPDLTTNVAKITALCLRHGLRPDNTKQTVGGITILPKDYLCPIDYDTLESDITENTLCIHHFSGSWIDDEMIYKRKILLKYSKILPKKAAALIAKTASTIKFKGMKTFFKKLIVFFRKKIHGEK